MYSKESNVDLEIQNALYLLDSVFTTVDEIVAFWRLYGNARLFPCPEWEKLRPWDKGLNI